MGWLRKGPLYAEISPNCDNEEPLTLLRNTVVCGIQYLMDNFVAKATIFPTRMVLLKPSAMSNPLFALPSCKLWVSQHQFDVAKVFRKGRPSQSAHVFN